MSPACDDAPVTPDSTTDPRYAVLFEPVPIGPVVARNRFFQVPHCNGMGYRDPSAQAAMRRVKAEGGWAVVCTEEVEIHPTSDVAPFVELRIWDDDDLPALARIAEQVHAGGSLAGIELAHNGMHAANLYTRETPLGPSHLPVQGIHPVQARAMTLADVADLRRWHRAAVRRAIAAGYDVVYVYAAHGLAGLEHFLSPRYNRRADAYGGSAENRMRLLREVLEDAREEADGRAAVACRLTVGELAGPGGLGRAEIEDVVGALAELPDLWDFVLGGWDDDSVTSRFGPEGHQEPYVRGLKALTSKPVVGVGRFTSPDLMVRQVRDGVLDLIGAARPSIADPFLPEKIRTNRLETIRECIGCNMCVSGDHTMSPIRCTQNPTTGEEYRRGWHPERVRPAAAPARVLVVGAGPAGLEAARAAGARGCSVVLAEASRDLGGRVTREALLPGLAAWGRVRDHREQALSELASVEVFRESPMTVEDALEHGFDHVAVAVGSRWRADGVGRWHTTSVPLGGVELLTPDDLMAGRRPAGRRTVLFDDDHYYLGGVLAELLVGEGFEVTLVTPAATVSAWTANTLELARVQRRVLEAGVKVRTARAVTSAHDGVVESVCVYTGRHDAQDADALVLVTARLPEGEELAAGFEAARADGHLRSVRTIGDCHAAGTIAMAVWSGRRWAEELDEPVDRDAVPFRREVTRLSTEP